MNTPKTHFADDETLAYIAKLEADKKELVEALAAYTVISPAFRNKDIGAPNSFERAKQEMHIKLEDKARAILAKHNGNATSNIRCAVCETPGACYYENKCLAKHKD